MLTSLWYPNAEWRELEALGVFAVWLVCWDDTVDANEGDLAGDFASAEAWRHVTLEVARESLGLSGDENERREKQDNIDALNAALRDFGHRFVASSASPTQRRSYLDELSSFIDNCGTEKKLRLESRIPRYDSYMEVRLGIVGGGLLCSLIDFANQQQHPLPEIIQSENARVLTQQVSVLLSLLNDILSLKKELSTDCVINAVASLLTRDTTLGGVVDEVYEKLRHSVATFDTAAESLVSQVRGDGELELAVNRYIDGCRSIVTGTLEFTLRSPRYKISKLLREDGSLEVIL